MCDNSVPHSDCTQCFFVHKIVLFISNYECTYVNTRAYIIPVVTTIFLFWFILELLYQMLFLSMLRSNNHKVGDLSEFKQETPMHLPARENTL